jgi:hypothetical protein
LTGEARGGGVTLCHADLRSWRRRVEYSGSLSRYYYSEAQVIDCGDFVDQRNYHRARRQKEESRKARQQKKLQRRLDRTTAEPESGVSETSPADPAQPIEPADEPTS